MRFCWETKYGVELIDEAIMKSLGDARDMYENGEIIEVAELLEDITEALKQFIQECDENV